MWTDSHCHIDGGAIEAAHDAGVTRLVVVGTDAAWSAVSIEVAEAHDGVWATVGLHPHDADKGTATIEPLLAGHGAKVVAVGECGLDYHYDYSPRPAQREAFAAQVALAHEYDLALVIHTREAWDNTWAVLRAAGVPARTVFHCFTGGPAEARQALELGAYLSFSGIITFPKAEDLREAARLCPLERLLVETDSPFLAPVPHRGKPNVPAYVPFVGAAVAAARGRPVSEVEQATWDNAARVFRLPA
ncbi:MAG: TatD family hydrolase [Acidimicrobiales bacterium]